MVFLIARAIAMLEATLLTMDTAYSDWAIWGEWPVLTVLIFVMYMLLWRFVTWPPLFKSWAGIIPEKGKRLEDEDLIFRDYLYVFINEIITVFYAVEIARMIKRAPYIVWGAWNMNPLNTVGTVLVACGCYDFVYYWFHRFLHIPAIYPYIHKHHHRQLIPFRGSWDGANTHPIEFIFGEFLHIGALWGSSKFISPHIVGVSAFLVASGFMGQGAAECETVVKRATAAPDTSMCYRWNSMRY